LPLPIPAPIALMDSSAVARQFARLVWLLVHDASNVDEQKRALRGVLGAARKQSLTLTLAEWRVLADGTALPEDNAEAQTLAAQMVGHAVKELRLAAAPVAAHVLTVARALAKEPQPGGAGRVIRESLRTLESPTVVAVMETVEPEADSLDAAPRAPRPPRRASGSYLAFAANPAPKSSIWELLIKLPEIESPEEATMLLEGIVALVNQALDEGKDSLVADTLCALVSGEDARTDQRVKRAYTIALRQLRKPRLARMVAKLLSKRPENLEALVALLGRWGEDGTEALIEELVVAETLAERRVLFDALVTVKAATSSLLRMLQDNRWFVLRNAAELLGELPSPDAEAPLAKLLNHDDERVRRAAAQSLGKIATGNAFASLRTALRDESAEVRLVAVTALGSWKRATSSQSLVVALDGEADGDVQLQIIVTLGRVATPDAVQRLIELTEPGGTLFNRKTAAVRLAAVHALGEAATPAAVAALKVLREDKDAAVREAAYRLVRAMRAPSPTTPD
jgi:HEAT repeat protein